MAQNCGAEMWHRIVAQKLDSEIRRRKGAAQKCGGTEMRRRFSALNCSAELRCRIVVQNFSVFAVFTVSKVFVVFTECVIYDIYGICGINGICSICGINVIYSFYGVRFMRYLQ